MNYQTFPPHRDLDSVVKCYWTLEADAEENPQRQRIVPDGCIEMAFILGDNIKRYIEGDKFILQPRAMILGQTIEPFYIEPTGCVNSFAARFYPYGFAAFVTTPIKSLANKETPLELLFGERGAKELENKIIKATSTPRRIEIIEDFLLNKFSIGATIAGVVKSTVDTMLSTKGSQPIGAILKEDLTKRRQLERKFRKQIGISPKQLGKVIRLQAALKMLINCESENLTRIAYDSEYYDQAHFIKDFKEFTGTTPKAFLSDEGMALSALFYK
ncbi:MAG: helix-turn-helix domain-containing protein [Chryseolinea sp.]